VGQPGSGGVNDRPEPEEASAGAGEWSGRPDPPVAQTVPPLGALSPLPGALSPLPGRPNPPAPSNPLPLPAGGPWRAPQRVEPVPGTPFAVAYLPVPKATSGPAIGSLVAGIGSLLVMLLVGCLGLIAAQANVGALVGGAFAVLATALGLAGVGLGLVGVRQVRSAQIGGRGLAISGIACGAAGVALSVLIVLLLAVTG
jgi:hypothetical protein